MSHDNVWEWLLEQCVFLLLPESWQRIGWRDIVGQTVSELCWCDRKCSTADGWHFERRNPQMVRSGRAECWSTRHVGDVDQRTQVAWWAFMQSLVCQNSHFVQYPFWSQQPVETDKCVSDVVASSQMIHQTGKHREVVEKPLYKCISEGLIHVVSWYHRTPGQSSRNSRNKCRFQTPTPNTAKCCRTPTKIARYLWNVEQICSKE